MTGRDIAILAITSVGLLNCFVFCLTYWVKTRGAWWTDEAGQFMMLFFGCLGMVFTVVIANRLFGDYPGREIAIFSLYVILVVATGWPLRLLFRSRRKQGRNENGHTS